MLDVQNNFAVFEAVGAYSSTDIAITVTALGNQSALQTPCNLVWYNHTDFPSNPSQDPNREIVRAISSAGTPPTLITVTRAQESIVATAKDIAGKVYRLVNVLTAKNISDIDAGIIGVDNLVFEPSSAGWTYNVPPTANHSSTRITSFLFNDHLDIEDVQVNTAVFPVPSSLFEGQRIVFLSEFGTKFVVDTNGALDSTGSGVFHVQASGTLSFLFVGGEWVMEYESTAADGVVNPPLQTLVFGTSSGVTHIPQLWVRRKSFFIASPLPSLAEATIRVVMLSVMSGDIVEVTAEIDVALLTISTFGVPSIPFVGGPFSIPAGRTLSFRLVPSSAGPHEWRQIIALPEATGAVVLPPVNLAFDPPFSGWSFSIPDTLALRTILRIEASDSTVLGGTIAFPSLGSLQVGQEVEIHTATQTTYTVNFNGASGDTALQDQYALTSVVYRHSGGVWRKVSVSSRRSATLFSPLTGPAALFVLPDPLLPLTEGIDQPSTPEIAIQLNGTGITSCNVNFATNGASYIVGTKITLIANTDIPVLTFSGLSSFAGFPTKLLSGESFTMRKTAKVPQIWRRTDNTSPAVLPLLEFMSRGRWMAKNAILVASLTGVDFGVVSGTPTLVACGTNTIIRSTDYGENWTVVAAPTGVWSGVAFKTGRFCLVENNLTAGTNQCAVSDDGGQTWTTGLTTFNGNWKVVAGIGNFIASAPITTTNPTVITSPDGLAPWTLRRDTGTSIFDIAYDPVSARVFRAGFGSASTTQVQFSVDDGVTWVDGLFIGGSVNRTIVAPIIGGCLLCGSPSTPSSTVGDIGIILDPIVAIPELPRSFGKIAAGGLVSRATNDIVTVGGGVMVSVGHGEDGSMISFDNGNNWSALQVAHAGPWAAMVSFQMPSGRNRVVAVAGGAVFGQSARVQTLDL